MQTAQIDTNLDDNRPILISRSDDPMVKALAYAVEHPEEPWAQVAQRFGIPMDADQTPGPDGTYTKGSQEAVAMEVLMREEDQAFMKLAIGETKESLKDASLETPHHIEGVTDLGISSSMYDKALERLSMSPALKAHMDLHKDESKSRPRSHDHDPNSFWKPGNEQESQEQDRKVELLSGIPTEQWKLP